MEGAHEEMADSGDVEALLHHLSEEWQKEGSVESVCKSMSSQEVETMNHAYVVKLPAPLVDNEMQKVTSELHDTNTTCVHSSEKESGDVMQKFTSELHDTNTTYVHSSEKKSGDVIQHVGSFANKQPAGSKCVPKSRQVNCDEKRPAKRTTSCPPGRAHSASAGPWSLEWVNRHKRDFIYNVRPSNINGRNTNSTGVPRVSKKKGSGYLRHCTLNLN